MIKFILVNYFPLDGLLDFTWREHQEFEDLIRSKIRLNNAKAAAAGKDKSKKNKQWEIAGFAARMEDAEKILDELKGQAFDFGAIKTALVLNKDGETISFVADKLKNPAERRYISAAWNWTPSNVIREPTLTRPVLVQSASPGRARKFTVRKTLPGM